MGLSCNLVLLSLSVFLTSAGLLSEYVLYACNSCMAGT